MNVNHYSTSKDDQFLSLAETYCCNRSLLRKSICTGIDFDLSATKGVV